MAKPFRASTVPADFANLHQAPERLKFFWNVVSFLSISRQTPVWTSLQAKDENQAWLAARKVALPENRGEMRNREFADAKVFGLRRNDVQATTASSL
jgi:hypothetical protein